MREVVREMTVKSGQKCTAIRRVLVPESMLDAASEAIAAKLAKITVGNPRSENVRMGALVSREQLASVRDGLAALKAEARVVHDGASHALVDAEPAIAACIGPTLLAVADADASHRVHELEVFGPAATLVPYRDIAHGVDLARRGKGSLVTSVYGAEPLALAQAAADLASTNGRVHVVSPDVGALHTGHGNVMPMSLHGGPGRAGGGEELGGLRALSFYHRRTAIQASQAVLAALPSTN
jgi:3,4-dehydroadipyl-CoA semialdehyde dehydrogenase